MVIATNSMGVTPMRSPVTGCLVVVALLMLGAGNQQIKASVAPSAVTVPIELGNQLRLRTLRDGTVVVVDTGRHRLVLLGASTKWLGGIGNGPGELYYPFDVAEAAD